jgi:hypothetical protein
MLSDVARATPYSEVDNNALEGFISLYGLRRVILTLDILAFQYREKRESVHNPTMVLAKAFIKGVTPPDNYGSYIERIKTLRPKEVSLIKMPQQAEKAEKSKTKEEKDGDGYLWKGM